MEKQNWEKEFDKVYGDNPFTPTTIASDGFLVRKEKVKSFIRKTLAWEKENWLEELESRQIKE